MNPEIVAPQIVAKKPRKKVVYDVIPSYEEGAAVVSTLIDAANTEPVIKIPKKSKKQPTTVADIVHAVVPDGVVEEPKAKAKRAPAKKKVAPVVETPVVAETPVAEEPAVAETVVSETVVEAPKKKRAPPKKKTEPVVVEVAPEVEVLPPVNQLVPNPLVQAPAVEEEDMESYLSSPKRTGTLRAQVLKKPEEVEDEEYEDILVESFSINGELYFIDQENRLYSNETLDHIGYFEPADQTVHLK